MIDATLSPSNVNCVPVKVASGKVFASKKSLLFRCVSSFATPVCTDVMSMSIVALPVFAAGSIVMLPLFASKCERTVDVPKWRDSAVTDVWVGSIV